MTTKAIARLLDPSCTRAPSLRAVATVAEALKVPPWALMLPGLNKHPELLRPGALAGLSAVVRAYLAGDAAKRSAIEAAAREGRQ